MHTENPKYKKNFKNQLEQTEKNIKKSLVTNDLIKINGYSLKKNLKKISWSIIQTKKALEFFNSNVDKYLKV